MRRVRYRGDDVISRRIVRSRAGPKGPNPALVASVVRGIATKMDSGLDYLYWHPVGAEYVNFVINEGRVPGRVSSLPATEFWSMFTFKVMPDTTMG
jgi:hypothetical protein